MRKIGTLVVVSALLLLAGCGFWRGISGQLPENVDAPSAGYSAGRAVGSIAAGAANLVPAPWGAAISLLLGGAAAVGQYQWCRREKQRDALSRVLQDLKRLATGPEADQIIAAIRRRAGESALVEELHLAYKDLLKREPELEVPDKPNS